MIKTSKSALLRASVAPMILGTTLLAGPALAQDVASPPAGEGEAIIVTGSRIARPDLQYASPIGIVSSDDINLRAGSVNIENVLNDLPQMVATTTSASNNPGGGVATVNLRGLDAERTLVLVDGRRYVSYDVQQIVDLNTIPSSLIQQVEVVTGGRSAVYGSDAIAGVVNFRLRRDFSGVELNSSYQLTDKGDGQIWNIDGTIGGNFDEGRGNVTLHMGYTERKAIYAGDREFSSRALQDNQDGTYIYGGSSSVPQTRINDSRLTGLTGAANNDFSSDGSLSPYVASTDAYNYSPTNYLQVPQERFLVSGMANYEVSEAVQPYLEAQFINNRVKNQLAPTPISNSTPYGEGSTGALTVHTYSPYLSSDVQGYLQGLDAAETGTAQNDGYVTVNNWGSRTTAVGARVNEDERNAYRIVGGVKGDIGSGWNYDAYYMYAHTTNTQRQTGNVAISNFKNATKTAFQNPTTGEVSATPFDGVEGGGTLVCADASAREAGCVPANIYGSGNMSKEAAEYLAISATNIETYTTEVASVAFTNPDIFDLGAGGVGLALGAEYRVESGSVTPDTYLASGNVAGFNPGQETSGSYNLYEFFGEVNVPLISDSFIHKLELNGATRFSHYSNAPGSVFTWSAGGLMAPIRDISLRGQYQRAIRGPNVYELYLGNTVSFEGNVDVCGTSDATSGTLRDVCLSQGVPETRLGDSSLGDPDSSNPPTFLGGNSDLKEETSSTFTVGAVITPSMLPGFSATVDYYNIKIDDYIDTVGTENIGRACFQEFLDEYCSLITRDSTGEISRIDDRYRNTGGLKTEGIDISINYEFPMDAMFGEGMKLGFNLAGSHLMKWDYTPVKGLDIVNKCAGKFGASCGVPQPKWRHSLRTTLGGGKFGASLLWRYIGTVSDDDPETTYMTERFGDQNYFDLTFTVSPDEHLTFNMGVSNMFDNGPPLTASTQQNGNGEQSNTYPSVYDVVGRTFFISARMRF